MTDTPQPSPPARSQFLVYQTESSKLELGVRLEGEAVWLIYEAAELQHAATHKDLLSVRLAGGESDSVVKNFFTTRTSRETAQARAERARRTTP